ncbi:hypothetical protein OESDEN_21605 [Oesophagostomum dentatum]|uniref:Carboxylesterase type B domain-containing protein n=1 Tax=Oesophagostomum dentatum TaxID=61180 RepID=A0A0B1S4H0_OESDE|nr:hypothetical protein OESDEN_21605 [Oesophagostomum dentatum]
MAEFAPPKVSIVGVTNNEASLFTLLQKPPHIHKLGIDSSEYAKWDREKFAGEIEKLVRRVYLGKHTQEVINEIVAQYTHGEKKISEFYINSYNELISDLLFNIPAADGIFARRKTRWDVFAYIFNYHKDADWNSNVPEGLRGAAHGSDLAYVTGVGLPEKFDEKEQTIVNLLQEAFAEFAREGYALNRW